MRENRSDTAPKWVEATDSPDSLSKTSRIFFDKRDYELINVINTVCCSDQEMAYARREYYRHFHPNGIKEISEFRSLRIAYSMVHLLTSLEVGGMDDRLNALQSLRDEVLDTAKGPMPKNTARVLLQIMKELVRTSDAPHRQLRLAHDFRITALGKPRIVREQLRKYHLLEMPEAWNQITFDDHVHDVNTKGRKSSTHLIMDAWIKGIRRLRVVHYHYIEPRFAAELIEAAHIMDIDLRIGIEFFALFRNRYVQLMWVPRGFADAQEFLCFLEEPAVLEMMNEGRKVASYQQAYVLPLLAAFNQSQRQRLNEALDIDMAPLGADDFIRFVGIGQKSKLHLEKYIHGKLLEALQAKAARLRDELKNADPETAKAITAWIEKMNVMDLETVVSDHLKPSRYPHLHDPAVPENSDHVPRLLTYSPHELLDRLSRLRSGYRVTLNLTDLREGDVLELLYDCDGMISRLELFNLKDWVSGKTEHIAAINALQKAINGQNPIALKQTILNIIDTLTADSGHDLADDDQIEKLTGILHDIIGLQSMYKGRTLKARIGSDSTGRSPRFYGMGLAVIDTLPKGAQKEVLRSNGEAFKILPIQIIAHRRRTFSSRTKTKSGVRATRRLRPALPLLHGGGGDHVDDWSVQGEATRLIDDGNVVTLGGVQTTFENQLYLDPVPLEDDRRLSPRYLNSHLKNFLKVLTGFVPAFITFYYTKEWWLLAYFGAFIWFGITKLRNIVQSVLGGGGLRRSPLLRWNDFVSWSRVADSLLFTGFSVPLLDYFTKTVLLDRGFSITTATHPMMLYSVMALVNGIYLSSHNAFRGLPKGAVIGNFFRSVLSIPIAIVINILAGAILGAVGIVGVDQVLQKWAAIISKAASDVMAGIIEGTADRFQNIQIRFRDYRKKLSELLDIYAQLELLFPENPALSILENPKKFRARANAEVRDLEKIICIHALDLLYFWMYQPRSRSAFLQLLETLTEEERYIFLSSQFTLQRKKDISQMFIDGVLGHDFEKSLSFYLSRYAEYLNALKRLA